MLSRRLWHFLNQRQPEHPLQRLVPIEGPSHKNRNRLLTLFILLPLCCVACGLVTTALFELPAIVPLLPFVISTLLNLLLLSWAIGIGALLSREHITGRWEQLAVMPLGSINICLILGRTWLRRKERIQRLKDSVEEIAVLSGALLVPLAIAASGSAINHLLNPQSSNISERSMLETLSLIIDIAGLILLLYVDITQTSVFAVIAGIVGSLYGNDSTDARLIAGILFVIIEIALYLVMIFASFVILPNLYASLGLKGLVTHISTLIAQFTMLIGGRELVLVALWRRVTGHLGDDAALSGI